MKTSNAGFSALVDFREELLRPRFFRVRENSCAPFCSMILPPSMNTTRFDTCRAKFISCVTTSIVMPSSANWRITFSTSPINSGSSADVGSSK